MGTSIRKENIAPLELVSLPLCQPEADPIEIRVQKALRKSDELIHQSNNLRETVFAMEERFDREAVLEGRRVALERNLYRSNSILEWAVDSA